MKLTLLSFICALSAVAAAPPPIAFLIVSDSQTPGSRYIDTPTLPKVGYVGAPEFEVSAIASLEKTKSPVHTVTEVADGTMKIESSETYSVDIGLLPADAGRFTALTTKAIGQRLLIEVCGAPVLAPNVRIPISTPKISVSAPDEQSRDALFETLKPFIKKP